MAPSSSPPPVDGVVLPPDQYLDHGVRSNLQSDILRSPASDVQSAEEKSTLDPQKPASGLLDQSEVLTSKRSFADVTRTGGVKSQNKLTMFGNTPPLPGAEILLDGGFEVIRFDNALTSTLSAPLQWVLVGKFSHGVPPFVRVGKFLLKLKLAGKFELRTVSPRQVLMIFSLEEDYARVWIQGLWQIGGYPMRVFKWLPTFNSKVETVVAPVWIRFPGLPAHLFDRRALFLIASSLGRPLMADPRTANCSTAMFARVCIELNLLSPRKELVVLDIDGIRVDQQVIYENEPEFCSFCSHLGHSLGSCYIKHESLKPTKKKLVNFVPSKIVDESAEVLHGSFFEDENGCILPLANRTEDLAVGRVLVDEVQQVVKKGDDVCSELVGVGGGLFSVVDKANSDEGDLQAEYTVNLEMEITQAASVDLTGEVENLVVQGKATQMGIHEVVGVAPSNSVLPLHGDGSVDLEPLDGDGVADLTSEGLVGFSTDAGLHNVRRIFSGDGVLIAAGPVPLRMFACCLCTTNMEWLVGFLQLTLRLWLMKG